jgi:diguanylate cyclase (GGDEF)-like protein/PAS domain S-box-containing protein
MSTGHSDGPTLPHHRITDAFERASGGLSISDLDGRIRHVNVAFADMLGWPDREELVGRRWADLMADDGGAGLHLVERLVSGHIDSFDAEASFYAADGSVRTVILAVAAIRDPDGTTSGLLAFAQDHGDRTRVNEELRGLADVDALTGIYNRRRFDQELARAIAHSQRYGGTLGVLLVDVDDLKPINDRLGHLAGDDLLRGIAARLADRLRRTDVLARIGGDEFAVLLPDTPAAKAARVAEDLVRAVGERAVHADGEDVRATITVGATAREPGGETDARALLRQADRALYAAKAAGGDRAQAFEG